MNQYEKDIFLKATKEKVNIPLYKVEYTGEKLVYTKVDFIPEIKEYIDDSYMIPLSTNLYFGYSVHKNLAPYGWFSNRAVLCSDNNYYIYNDHSFMPEYVKLIPEKALNDYSGKYYPESLDECVEVVVK